MHRRSSPARAIAIEAASGGPSFTAPIYASLFDDEDGEGHSLVWSRPQRRDQN